jgi:hypothetical protein
MLSPVCLSGLGLIRSERAQHYYGRLVRHAGDGSRRAVSAQREHLVLGNVRHDTRILTTFAA